MKEEQKNKSSRIDEEMKTNNQSGWRKFFKKKWFFPAIYLGSAALILALIMWYQNPNDYEISDKDLGLDTVQEDHADQDSLAGKDTDSVPVNADVEKMIWPVAQDEEVQVVMGFFDDNSTEEQQMAAMVEYEKSYHPHQGIDLSREDGETFDVVAALSGTVVKADKEALIGWFIEIEHKNGLMTVYQSLEEVQVKEGDTVKQGDVIAKAGRNEFEKALGVHLHFEVRENGIPVNPDGYLSNQKEAMEQQ